MWRTVARARQGRSLLWCSSIDTSTTSPGAKASRCDSLLMASVVFLPKTTTCSPARAPTNCATVSRAASKAALARRLSDKGVILVTVPAFPFLWSRHDERHHHFRRYTRKTLAEVAAKAGLKVRYSSYFNFFLFPAAVAFQKRPSGVGTTWPTGSSRT